MHGFNHVTVVFVINMLTIVVQTRLVVIVHFLRSHQPGIVDLKVKSAFHTYFEIVHYIVAEISPCVWAGYMHYMFIDNYTPNTHNYCLLNSS